MKAHYPGWTVTKDLRATFTEIHESWQTAHSQVADGDLHDEDIITGACGFVGSTLARGFVEAGLQCTVLAWIIWAFGKRVKPAWVASTWRPIDSRNLRCQRAVDSLPAVDWVIDCAANPSVLAARTASQHRHSWSTICWEPSILLEWCKKGESRFHHVEHQPGLRHWNIWKLPVEVANGGFRLAGGARFPRRIERGGLPKILAHNRRFRSMARANWQSEVMALEYALTFHFPAYGSIAVRAGGRRNNSAGLTKAFCVRLIPSETRSAALHRL